MEAQSDVQPKLLSIATLAKRWDFSGDTIRQMCISGRLPCVEFRNGGRTTRRIPLEVVEAMERVGKKEPRRAKARAVVIPRKWVKIPTS